MSTGHRKVFETAIPRWDRTSQPSKNKAQIPMIANVAEAHAPNPIEQAAIGEILGTFMPQECANYFKNSGYRPT
jgi:hypothetical protein